MFMSIHIVCMQRQVFSVAFEFLKKLCKRIPSNSKPFDSLMVKIGRLHKSFGRAFIATLDRTRIAWEAQILLYMYL